MPETKLLTVEDVARVAATIENNEPLRAYLAQFDIDIPALCQTVRALKDERDNYADEVNALADQLAQVTQERSLSKEELAVRGAARLNEDFRARAVQLCKEKAAEFAPLGIAAKAVNELREQLEQLK